jgi:hypothetical protein
MGCASGDGACGRTGNGGMKMTDCRVNHRRQPLCSTRLTRALRGVRHNRWRYAACSVSKPSPFVVVSERSSPFTTAGFAGMIERAARKGLGLELKAHPHMLRHACGMPSPTEATITRAVQDGWGVARSRAQPSIPPLAPGRFRNAHHHVWACSPALVGLLLTFPFTFAQCLLQPMPVGDVRERDDNAINLVLDCPVGA